jgi:hypothetical protein
MYQLTNRKNLPVECKRRPSKTSKFGNSMSNRAADMEDPSRMINSISG